MGDVLLGEARGRREGQVLALRDGPAQGHRGAHGVHRVDRIHRRGARVLQGLVHRLEVGLEAVEAPAPERPGSLGQSVGGRRADRAGSPDDHVGDGLGRLAVVAGPDDPELVGQEPLLDEHHRVGDGVESDGAVGPALAPERDVHAGRG